MKWNKDRIGVLGVGVITSSAVREAPFFDIRVILKVHKKQAMYIFKESG